MLPCHYQAVRDTTKWPYFYFLHLLCRTTEILIHRSVKEMASTQTNKLEAKNRQATVMILNSFVMLEYEFDIAKFLQCAEVLLRKVSKIRSIVR